MDPAILKEFALERMGHFGLVEKGWTFRYDSAKRRFGVCKFDRKEISLSIHLVRLNSREECEDTVLHEIAHALAGRHAGHGPEWKAACRHVGARPERCYTSDAVSAPSGRFEARCPSCITSVSFHRRPQKVRACAACCREHSGGRFDERFLLKVYDRRSGQEVGYARPTFILHCRTCHRKYTLTRRIRAARACSACCKSHGDGRYDERFRLDVYEVKA
jgi:predicted SprT family Zn-dependent metalloprotease